MKVTTVPSTILFCSVALLATSCLSLLCALYTVPGGKSHITDGSSDMSVYLRSSLARTIYERMREDEAEIIYDKRKWYMVRPDLLCEEARTSLIPCSYDEDTRAFVEHSREQSDWLFTQIYQSLAKSLLSWFLSPTSINGLLRRGSMFVYSNKQFRSLLRVDSEWKSSTLLDIGAGDGEVTRVMATMFEDVYTTEMSTPMVWRLKEKGYTNLGVDEWARDGFYDVISCLNVLDRCSKPLTLLRDIRRSLRPATGRAVVAMVLPYSPYVEFGAADAKTRSPTERLEVTGSTWEEQAASLVTRVFHPLGLLVVSLTRLPYLCQGDLSHSYYSLDDAVFVLQPA